MNVDQVMEVPPQNYIHSFWNSATDVCLGAGFVEIALRSHKLGVG